MQTILGRTLLSFFALIFLLVGILVTTLWVTKQQKDDGLIVNLSGRQRMLTQKMSKETLIYYRISNQDNPSRTAQVNGAVQVAKTMEVFEKTLFALKNGGPAPLDLKMTRFRDCPPAETTEIDDQLGRVINLWEPIKAAINKVIKSKGKDFWAMDYVIANNVDLLANMNKVVFMMQEQAEKKVALMVKVQAFAIGLGLLIVVISIFAIKSSVITPLKSLIGSAESMSTGDLSSEVEATGLKEIEVLSSSLNRMRMSLLAMMQRFKQSA